VGVGAADFEASVRVDVRVAARPRGATGGRSPVLCSSAAVQPPALAASNAFRAVSVASWTCCWARAAVSTALLCASSASPSVSFGVCADDG